MKKNSLIIVDDLKKKELKNFNQFIKKFYNYDILIDNKYYRSAVLNKKLLEFLFFNKKRNKYNFKIIKYKNKIICIHGYIPISKFDNKLDDNTVCLGLLIGSDKMHFPLIPISYSAISNIDKVNFIYTINPIFASEEYRFGSDLAKTSIFLEKIKKFTINKMSHHFAFSNDRKRFVISNINKVKSEIKDKNNSLFKILKERNLKKLTNDNLFKNYIPKKSIKYVINRYFRHPIFKYILFGCYNLKFKLKIILITREVKFKNSKALKIVDIIGENEDIIYANNFLINLAKRYEYIDLYSHGIPKNILKNVGFNNVDEHPNVIIPDYFEPFKKTKINLYCGFNNNFNEKLKVRLFKGDGDQDCPRSK